MTNAPPPPQPPYGYAPQAQPPTQYPPAYYPPAPKRTNGLAIASMVLGIVWIYWIGSVLAVIFAFVAKKQIRESNGAQGGDGMATAGLVLGFIGVATFVIFMIILIAAASNSSPSYP